MERTITITYSSVIEAIKRHLSYMGKRSTDQRGNNMFSDVTLSSLEQPLLHQYIDAAIQNVIAVATPFIHQYTHTQTQHEFVVENTRWGTSSGDLFDGAFVDGVTTYCVLYTVGEYLGMAHGDYAKKYYDDAAQRLDALQRLLYFKAPQTCSDSYETVNGEIL